MWLRLEQWSLRSRPYGQVEPPEGERVCLYGFIMGHPAHRDGREVLTSPVIRRGPSHVVTKSGSRYELGVVDPGYERCYPGAWKRLCARLAMDEETFAEPAEAGPEPAGAMHYTI